MNSYFEMNFNITEAILYAFVFIKVDSKSDRSKLIKFLSNQNVLLNEKVPPVSKGQGSPASVLESSTPTCLDTPACLEVSSMPSKTLIS